MNKEERIEIVNFVDKYKELNQQVDLMQKSILSLAEKRDKLISKLEETQKEENLFIKTLIEKYGEENITPYKLLKCYEEE